jgi:subtilase family serine protease
MEQLAKGEVLRTANRLCFAVLAIGTIATSVTQAATVTTAHVRSIVSTGEAKLVGKLPPDQMMTLDIVLQLRDRAGLQSFLADINNPTSPNYRKFVTPAQFTEKFGPTKSDYDAVVTYAKSFGLSVVGGTHDGFDVQVKGPVSAVEAAFHVNIKTYQDTSSNRVFFAPDKEPTANLPFALWHVSGLDNYSIPHAMFAKKSDFLKARGVVEGVSSNATTGSGPSGSFLGSDMRAAYYGTNSALTGAGQNLGLLEYYGTDLADLNTYYTNVKQTREVPVTLLSTDGTSTSCLASQGCDDTEQTIDMTQALGMAPGLASLTLYIGSTDTAMISAMTTHSPLPTTIGCSWTWTPVDPTTLDPYFEKMAAQGQNFFTASGDSSTWRGNGAWPPEDANVVTVGGTDLVTESAGGAWKSETGWEDSGGGIAPNKIAIPSWQSISGVITSTNKGSTVYRNGPDVAANANFTFYVCADQTTCSANEYGGTSFATPMWAAFVALANELLVKEGKATIGYLNPIIYPQNVTSAYATNFHDITSGTSGSYSAVAGYDLVTGWGSPKVALIKDLYESAP